MLSDEEMESDDYEYLADSPSESRYFCPDCNVGLCVTPCFRLYHTAQDNDKQEVAPFSFFVQHRQIVFLIFFYCLVHYSNNRKFHTRFSHQHFILYFFLNFFWHPKILGIVFHRKFQEFESP